MKKGFTLIELLVVIAIIAILAAILFPVFAKVREKARQITCVSDEKQMALGVIQYIQDNDEKYPLLQYAGPTGEIDWYAGVMPYIENGSLDVVSNVDYNYGQGGIWNCPDFPQDKTGIGVGLPFSEYGMIRGLAGEPQGTGIPSASLADVDKPATEAMIIEHGAAWYTPWGGADQNNWDYIEVAEWSWTTGIGCPACNPAADSQAALQYDYDSNASDSPSSPAWTGPGDMPRYRHSNTTNVVFNDGHAKSIVKGQLNWYNNIYIPVPYARLDGAPY